MLGLLWSLKPPSSHQETPTPAPACSPPRPPVILRLLLEECVGVKIHTDDISRRVVQIEITGVDPHDEGHGGTQHIRQHQRAQRNVGALPVQREDHLEHQGVRASESR